QHAQAAAAALYDATREAGQAVADAATAYYAAGRARTFADDVAAEAYGHEAWRGLGDQLTDDQHVAVGNYSGEVFAMGNRYLRGRSPRDALPEWAAQAIDQNVPDIDAALQVRPVPEDIMVVRVSSPSAFTVPLDRAAGTVQRDAGYLSTSLATGPKVPADKG